MMIFPAINVPYNTNTRHHNLTYQLPYTRVNSHLYSFFLTKISLHYGLVYKLSLLQEFKTALQSCTVNEIKCTSSGNSTMVIANGYLLSFMLYSSALKALEDGNRCSTFLSKPTVVNLWLWVQFPPKPNFLKAHFFSDHRCLSFVLTLR